MNTDWRNDPASEKQKEKLGYFGCTWDEGITKGQASDAIDECIKLFPEIEAAYYNRPATEEQRAKLQAYGVDPDGARDEEDEDTDEPTGPLTYGQAKDWLEDLELDARATEEEQFFASLNSEDAQIDEALGKLNCYWPGAFRDITKEEFVQVWALAKSRKAGDLEPPAPSELICALKELFPEFS
ncbi:MAG: hypothetical protein ACXWDN_02990 [Limisphaerales bacterium]